MTMFISYLGGYHYPNQCNEHYKITVHDCHWTLPLSPNGYARCNESVWGVPIPPCRFTMKWKKSGHGSNARWYADYGSKKMTPKLTRQEIINRCAHIRANPALALFIAKNKFIQALRHPAEVKTAKEFVKKMQETIKNPVAAAAAQQDPL